MKKLVVMGTLFGLSTGFVGTGVVSADEVIKGGPEVGDVIVAVADDLTKEQRETIVSGFGVAEGEVPFVGVSIDDEKQYLGNYISMERIGDKTYSSAKIEILEEGSGVVVESKNIAWVSDEMYANALITAGIKDAKVTIDSPYRVSGTGALTGIMKAYDTYEKVELDEGAKDVATEEMVMVAELGDEVGKEEASLVLTRIKDAVVEGAIVNEETAGIVVDAALVEFGVEVPEATRQELVALAVKMSELDMDWSQVGEQIDQLKENALNLVESQEAQEALDKAKGVAGDAVEKAGEVAGEAKGFFEKVIEFFGSMLDGLGNLFGGKE